MAYSDSKLKACSVLSFENKSETKRETCHVDIFNFMMTPLSLALIQWNTILVSIYVDFDITDQMLHRAPASADGDTEADGTSWPAPSLVE